MTQSFEQFLRDNKDEIEVLHILYSKPYAVGLSLRQVKALASQIERTPSVNQRISFIAGSTKQEIACWLIWDGWASVAAEGQAGRRRQNRAPEYVERMIHPRPTAGRSPRFRESSTCTKPIGLLLESVITGFIPHLCSSQRAS
jgi:hypothetical protein